MGTTNSLKRLMRRELQWRKLWFDEKYPIKFATTAWVHSQQPFLVYRVITFAYSMAILSWQIHETTQLSPSERTAWALSYPVWGFILMVLYNILSLLCAGFNFDLDCLCNDDLRWYHKVSWILQELAFNATVVSFGGSMIYFISRETGNDEGMLVTDAFKSENINFYLISALLMAMDIMISSITIHLLHVIYPGIFFVIYNLIHVYRWAAGDIPTHRIFYFSSLPASTIALFSLITFLLVVPFVHILAYGIDYGRRKLIMKIRAKNKHQILRTVNSSTSPEEKARRVGENQSSVRYQTSAFQTKLTEHPPIPRASRTYPQTSLRIARDEMRLKQAGKPGTLSSTEHHPHSKNKKSDPKPANA